MIKFLAATVLATVAGLLFSAGIRESQLVGKWSGRIERPGVEAGRRMAQIGTAEFLPGHRFVCQFADPDQRPLTEQGTWSLNKGRLSITADTANGKKITPEVRRVEMSQPLPEMRLPVKSGAWFLVLRPVEASE